MPLEQRRRHGVAQHVGMDALGDARQHRCFLHELLDTPRGIPRMACRLEQRAGRATL